MNVISPKLKFVMKIVFKPIATSALLSDDQKNADIGLILVYDITYKTFSAIQAKNTSLK